jgi:hypothetical protein
MYLLGAQNKKLAQRHAAAQLLAAQQVHVDVTHIAEDKPGAAVKHAQALRHVVERNARQEITPALLRDGDESANRQEDNRQKRR